MALENLQGALGGVLPYDVDALARLDDDHVTAPRPELGDRERQLVDEFQRRGAPVAGRPKHPGGGGSYTVRRLVPLGANGRLHVPDVAIALLVLALAACGEPTELDPVDTSDPFELLISVTTSGALSGDSVRHDCRVVVDVHVQGTGASINMGAVALPAFGVISTASLGTTVTENAPARHTLVAGGAVPGTSLETVVNYTQGVSGNLQERRTVHCESDYDRVTDTVEVVVGQLPSFMGQQYGAHGFTRPPGTSAPRLLSCTSQPIWGTGTSAWENAEVRNDTVTWGQWPTGGYAWPSLEPLTGGCWVFLRDWRGSNDVYLQQGSPMFTVIGSAPETRLRVVRSYWSP